ncbi:MAG TPA: flagellar motor stator protein MotA [Candidatus Mailhella excrementigallinarum]|nr:MAG: flagellar motor stator protein MotA [Desulfovibrionaceae bacterium]HIV65884.1 flagellar motor stator protein MotA [Candidatus Mailhella excrementigallinarum]
MFLIIGYVIVIGSVLGGFMLENGNPLMLWQPAELLIIVGAGLGAFLGAQTRYSGRLLLQSLKRLFRDPGIGREQYLEMLALLFFIFNKMNRDGPLSLEQDIEKPENSAIFGKYPSIAAKPGAVNFIADTLRVYVTTGDQGEIENLMKLDMRVSLEEDLTPAHGITHMAESLPGMGIVAAVMGVVLTMSMINEPPEVLGHHIGAALVGTFTGILFCYGIFGPMGEKLEHFANEEHFYYNAIKEAIAASLRGASPLIAVEYGRRSIPQGHRPTFSEMEEYVRKG